MNLVLKRCEHEALNDHGEAVILKHNFIAENAVLAKEVIISLAFIFFVLKTKE